MPGSQKDHGDFTFQLDHTFSVTGTLSLSLSLSLSVSHTHTHCPGNTVGMASLLESSKLQWMTAGQTQTDQEYICN